MPTAGTGTAGVVLILQIDEHPMSLRFVGELEPDRAMRPLVDFLVVSVSNIVVLPDISHIANDHGSHALLIKRGDQPCGLLVFDISNLVLNLLQLPFLGPNEPLSSLTAFLHATINAATQFSLQFVPVLDFRAQESSVEDMGMLTIMRDGHMYLA